MAKYVLDAGAVLRVVGDRVRVNRDHALLAPRLVQSETLSLLHEAVVAGELAADDAFDRVHRIRELRLRMLSDRVLHRRAWEIADQLGHATTYRAEYVALTLLQGDALVTTDQALVDEVGHLVTTATVDDLRTPTT